MAQRQLSSAAARKLRACIKRGDVSEAASIVETTGVSVTTQVARFPVLCDVPRDRRLMVYSPLIKAVVENTTEAEWLECAPGDATICLRYALAAGDLAALDAICRQWGSLREAPSTVVTSLFSDDFESVPQNAINWLEDNAPPLTGTDEEYRAALSAAEEGDLSRLTAMHTLGLDLGAHERCMDTVLERAAAGLLRRGASEEECLHFFQSLLQLGAKPADDFGMYPNESFAAIRLNSAKLLDLLSTAGARFLDTQCGLPLERALVPPAASERIRVDGRAVAAEWLFSKGHPVVTDERNLAYTAIRGLCPPLYYAVLDYAPDAVGRLDAKERRTCDEYLQSRVWQERDHAYRQQCRARNAASSSNVVTTRTRSKQRTTL